MGRINTENGLILLVVLLFGIWIGIKLFAPKVENTVTVKETIRVDTVYVKVDTSFTKTATPEKPINPDSVRPKEPDKDPQPEKYDSVRSYSGTYQFDYGKFDWNIQTGGILNGYTFTPSITVPTIKTERERIVTVTKTIIQKGFFAGGGINSRGNIHAGAAYLGDKFLVEYNFVPLTVQTFSLGTHQVGLKYKIF